MHKNRTHAHTMDHYLPFQSQAEKISKVQPNKHTATEKKNSNQNLLEKSDELTLEFTKLMRQTNKEITSDCVCAGAAGVVSRYMTYA